MEEVSQNEVEPAPINIVFLGVDLGSKDMSAAYWRYDGEVFTSITKEEYERLNASS